MTPSQAGDEPLVFRQVGRDNTAMTYARLAVIGATLIALATVAVAEPPARTTSGIEGTIVVSPARPGPITKGEPSDTPVRDAQFVVKAGDATVATFTTDHEGRFQVMLQPGHYVVLLGGAAPAIGSWRFEANVVAGQMTKVTWMADSGMR